MDQKELIKNYNFALKAQKEGKNLEAIKFFEKIIKAEPNHFPTNFFLGSLYAQNANFKHAIKLLSKAQSLNPKMPDVHNNLGRIYLRLGQLDKATISLNKAIEIKPNFAAAFCNLGLVNDKLGKIEEAINYYKKSIAINSKDGISYFNLGNLYRKINDIINSEKFYLLSIKSNPKFFAPYNNLLDLYERTNKRDKLIERIKSAEAIFKNNITLKLIKGKDLFNIKKFREAIELLENFNFEKSEIIKEKSRIAILAKSHDQIGEFEKAFKYFEKANEISLNINNKFVNKKKTLNMIEKRTNFFKDNKVKNWKQFNSESKESPPIFIIGFPRSGTTLLDTILSSHPLIEVIEEKPIIENWIKAIQKEVDNDLKYLHNINESSAQKFRKMYFDLRNKNIKKNNGKKIYIDKMPLNIIYAGEILRIFPDAKFIMALRHPCDCVLSCFMQSFKMNDAMSNFLNLKDSANFYDSVMKIWQLYINTFSINQYTVKYEDVVTNFEKSINNILDFLEVAWSKNILEFYKTAPVDRLINTPSYDQVNKPIYKKSLDKWKNYKDQMQNVLPILNKWMKKYNYN
jgi:tetratricopeptide (TPR) repeat protein